MLESGIPTPENVRQKDAVALAILFLLALCFRLIRLFDLDMRFDEVVLLLQIDNSFKDIWNFCKLDNYPPLYPWLLKLLGNINRHDNWFRLFGALLGSLTAPAAFLLGRQLLDRKLGLLLGIATAISVSLISYSQFVRMFNIQPCLVCLSLLWFLKAIKTNHWRYWFLMGITNLLGFYVYIFMIFIFTAELFILIASFRLNLKPYFRVFISNIPFFVGVIAWAIPLIGRYGQIQEDFWIGPFSITELVKLWVFLGTGSGFRDQYWLVVLLNLPFLIGFCLNVFKWQEYKEVLMTSILFILIVVIFSIFSIFGQSIFERQYFTFVLPIYLGLVLVGWSQLSKKWWRFFGLGWIAISMLVSVVYYYLDYYKLHESWGFVRPAPFAEKNEGHAFSTLLSVVAEEINQGEVIIHYSDYHHRFRGFFTALYYHKRAYSEHIYTKDEISQCNGRQYLRPGEWIRSLSDLDPLPGGVWLISLNNTEDFFDEAVLQGRKEPRWIHRENLPLELRQAGYVPIETIRRGKVTAIHFRRAADISPEQEAEL